jgi:hypothetical protein
MIKFFRLKEAGAEVIGTISMKKGVLVTDPPDHPTLRNVLDDEVRVYDGDEVHMYNAIHHPNEFLANLPKMYRGTYFWCKEVKDKETDK